MQAYFKALQNAQTVIVYIQDTVTYKVLICQGINQLKKHIDLNEVVDYWKKKIASQKTWKKFKTHFKKSVKKNQKCSSTLREIEISNQDKEQVETNYYNTEMS